MSYRSHQKGSAVVISNACKKFRDLIWVIILQIVLMQGPRQIAVRTAAFQCPEQRRVPGDGRLRWELMASSWALQDLLSQSRCARNPPSGMEGSADIREDIALAYCVLRYLKGCANIWGDIALAYIGSQIPGACTLMQQAICGMARPNGSADRA